MFCDSWERISRPEKQVTILILAILFEPWSLGELLGLYSGDKQTAVFKEWQNHPKTTPKPQFCFQTNKVGIASKRAQHILIF